MAADFTKLKLAQQITRDDILFALARQPGTERVFVGSSDFKLYGLDFAAEKPEPSAVGEHGSYVTAVAAVGKQLVSGSYDCRLKWWDAESNKLVRDVEAHAKRIRQLAVSPDGKLLASVADDMVCKLWNTSTGKLVRELKGHDEKTPNDFPSMLYAVAFSSDGKLLATGDKPGRVCVWNVADGKQLAVLDASGVYTWDPKARQHSIGGIRSVAFSPDGATIAVGGCGKIGNVDHLESPGRLEVFDWKSGKQKFVLSLDAKNKGLIEQLRFSPDGKWLVGAGGAGGGFIAFFDVTAGKILYQDSAPMHVHGLALSDDGGTIYASGHNRLAVWKL
jgi:WD40 repeat protein